MNRRQLAPLALALVLVTSGCLGMFGGISEERLCEDVRYDWNTTANATYTIETNNSYTAVYAVENASSMEFHQRDGFGNDQPLQISAVQFHTEDGTTYDCEDIDVETTRHETIVEFPESDGQFAYTADSPPKRFATQRFADGSHEVILAPNREVSNPVFGSVQPSGYETERVDDRLHIQWEDATSRVLVVQYYLDRDVPLFLGLILVAGFLALFGIAHYYRLIQELAQQRREAGLDIDLSEDDGDEPPPGMQ